MNENTQLAEVDAFLRRYRALETKYAEDRTAHFARGFLRLRTLLPSLKELAHAYNRELAPHFNLFQVLGVSADENRHSAFLRELLDPTARHGQGLLFLEGFLDLLRAKPGWESYPAPPDEPTAGWRVENNHSTASGILDLIVEAPERRFLLVVENKVYAGEQEEQLSRYGRWLSARSGFHENAKALVFLTPDGRASDTAGTTRYVRLSYREDIVAWLKGSLSRVGAHRLRECLRQYIEVVGSL